MVMRSGPFLPHAAQTQTVPSGAIVLVDIVVPFPLAEQVRERAAIVNFWPESVSQSHMTSRNKQAPPSSLQMRVLCSLASAVTRAT